MLKSICRPGMTKSPSVSDSIFAWPANRWLTGTLHGAALRSTPASGWQWTLLFHTIYCSAQYYSAQHCTVLHHTALYYTLYYIILYYNKLCITWLLALRTRCYAMPRHSYCAYNAQIRDQSRKYVPGLFLIGTHTLISIILQIKSKIKIGCLIS